MKLALSLVCALSAHAQLTATLSRLPDGWEEIRVRNQGAIDVVAFAVYAEQTPRSPGSARTPYIAYTDSLEPQGKPLAPKEEQLVIARSLIPPGAGSIEEPIVTAGILEDGTTFGDRTLLTRLLLRRCNLLLAVETTLDMLLGAGSRNVPRGQLIGQFQDLANALNRWYVPPEQQAGRTLYQSMVGKLTNLPKEPPGSAFPPNDFVTREAAQLSRLRSGLLDAQPSLSDAAWLR